MESKSLIRKQMLAKRDSLTAKEVQELGAEIARRLTSMPEVESSSIIGVYLAKGNEAPTEPFIRSVIGKKEVIAPVTNGHISFMKLVSPDNIMPGKFGVPEPKGRIEPSGHPGVVLVPGVAFAENFHRIGYGKGYYDKLFAHLKAFRIGVCYDFQIVEHIAHEPHDAVMDAIVTEKRVLRR